VEALTSVGSQEGGLKTHRVMAMDYPLHTELSEASFKPSIFKEYGCLCTPSSTKLKDGNPLPQTKQGILARVIASSNAVAGNAQGVETSAESLTPTQARGEVYKARVAS
jgi:hypothetical protein